MDHSVNNNNDKFGLVLCGGGAKGAYQIGIWEYLITCGRAKNIGAISGASVGSLNALLIAQGDLEIAKKVWREATPDMIMMQDRLQTLIEKSLYAWDAQKTDRIPLYACISNVTDLPPLERRRLATPDYVFLSDLSKEDCIKTVLASSAVPVIVQPHKIHGKSYIDGGIADNMPIRPLVLLGYKEILIVHLDPKNPVEDFFFQNAVQDLDISGVTFRHIYPKRSHTPIDFFSL